MAAHGHVLEPQPAGAPAGGLTGDRSGGVSRRLAHAVATVRHAPELVGLVGLAGLLNMWALGRNGWANNYYSAAVRSMAASWHNFLYVALDPSGVMSVDKPPLSLWVQTLSVRVFGYHPLAILLPQALMGVASVVLVYDLVRRPFGRIGGFVAGIALATTPIAVAMSRDNNPDALLTLCAVAAVWFAVRAFGDGRTRWLVCSGIAVGLGFETKMGVALVVVPAIALAWLWVAPRGRVAAIRQLLAGGGAMVAVGGAWPLAVALTPAADRPWISGTADNTILSLIFGYNGFGRVSGQTGGPAGAGGGSVFGGATGPLRLLNSALGGQGGWLLGLAVVGAIAVLVASRARRRDPRTGWILVVGGSFLVTAVLFSAAHGIFHPYYVVLLAPFTAALVGAGVATVIRGEVHVAAVGTIALVAGVVCEFVVLDNYSGQLGALRIALPIICGGAAISLFIFTSVRGRTWAMGLGTAVLLIAPTVWAFDTLGYATAATFPAGGPASVGLGVGGFGGGAFAGGGFSRPGLRGRRPSGSPPGGGFGGPPPGSGPGSLFANQGGAPFGGGGFGANSSLPAVETYVKAHGGGTIAVSSQSTAASEIIASNAKVAGIGGFSGRESVPTVSWLAQEVASGAIRWVFDDSSGSTGFGSDSRPGAKVALAAAARVCKAASVSSAVTIYDCAGKAQALRRLGR